MADKFPSSRVLSSRHDDLLIEALAPVEGGGGGFQPMAFPSSLVSFIHGLPDDMSAIVLQNGITIPVALPFAELKRQVYQPDIKTGNSLDLSQVTGNAVIDAQKISLSKKFNPVSSGDEDPPRPLSIRLFLEGNREGGEVFIEDDLQEFHMEFIEPHADDPGRKSYVKLVAGYQFTGGRDKAWINMPFPVLQAKIAEAKKSGISRLDLLEETRQKPPPAIPPYSRRIPRM